MEHTVQFYDRTTISITKVNGQPTSQPDVIAAALNGNAFDWESPDDLRIVLPAATNASVSFQDADGRLSDDPYSGANVIDQQLSQPVTVAGQRWSPSTGTIRWGSPPPVTVEAEFLVVLFDAGGTAYEMAGLSITTAYTTQVVGLMFTGAAPPPGTELFYRRGLSSYTQDNFSFPIPEGGGIPCFLAGTLIDTPRGPRLIEELAIGDLVNTLDHGAMPIRWIGRSQVDGMGDLAPVRIMAGALGNRRDLWLSPNHRIFLRAARAQLWFGTSEVLVAIKHLVNGKAIRREPVPVADYLHLALDDHQMVFSEGIATESLLAGPMALATLDPAAQAELRAIFPALDFAGMQAGRRDLTATEARLIRDGWINGLRPAV